MRASIVAAPLLLILLWSPLAAQEPVRLSVEDAVRLALQKNLDLEIERVKPEIARERIVEARAEFHPWLDYSLSYSRTDRYLNNALEVQADEGVVQEDFVIPEASLKGKFTSGTTYDLTARLTTMESDNPLRLFDTSYTPYFALNLRQPLLRGFGFSVNKVRIKQAEGIELQATLEVKAQMLKLIRDIEMRYWLLAYAQDHVEVTEGSLQVAEQLINRLGRMREAGLATDLDVSQARLAAEGRRADLARARADLLIAQTGLRAALDPNLPITTPLVSVEEPLDEGPPVKLQEMIDRALASRPEIEFQEAIIENFVLEEKLARSNTRWQLDATGNTTYMSLGGEGVNPRFDDPVGLLTVQRPLPGGLEERDSISDSLEDGNYSWSLGLSLQIPLGSRSAFAQLVPTRLRRHQEELRLTRIKTQIRVELETAYHNMTAEWSRLNSAREAVGMAEKQLTAEERNLEVGLSNVWDVIEAQDRLATARDVEARSLRNYATARSRLQASQALSFDIYRLVVEE